MSNDKLPMQPIITDKHGTVRFRRNQIVDKLLLEASARGFGLNQLACLDFPQADWEQFYQLIGYSVCGYHELSNVSDASALEASAAARLVLPDAGGCRDEGCKHHCGVARVK